MLHTFLRQHSIDPMKTIALAWAVRATSAVDGIFLDIDGGLLVPPGTCYHFQGLLPTNGPQSVVGPVREVTAWDAPEPSDARSIYGDLMDAGLELRRRTQAS